MVILSADHRACAANGLKQIALPAAVLADDHVESTQLKLGVSDGLKVLDFDALNHAHIVSRFIAYATSDSQTGS